MSMKIENEDYCAYRKAISQWGCTNISLKAAEECNELSRALVKNAAGIGDYHNTIEELVDVMIMCEQVFSMLDDGTFNRIWDEKMQRFKNRLETNTTFQEAFFDS